MTLSARALATSFGILLSAGLLAAQQPATPPPATPPPAGADGAQQPPPRIRSSINYVMVDVIVTDNRGNPVLDLKPEEFTVSEDNKPQKVDTFEVIKIDEVSQMTAAPPRAIRNEADEEREAARPDVRMFVLLLDDYHVRRGNDMASRKPIIEFIQNQLAPADMVALMYPLTPIADLRFSRNRAALISAVEKFEGRKGDYVPRNSFEEQYAYYPAQTVERIRTQVTMDALKGAAVKMGGIREGRKSIIFVSEGFTATLPTQLNDPVAAMPGRNNPFKGNAFAPQAGDREKMINESDMIFDMRQVFDTLNRFNTSIYAVDPRGLAVFEYGIEQGIGLQTDQDGLRASTDTLRVLADNTDGRAIVNRNDLAAGMKQIIRDASGYYLLGYNSSQAPKDGKFHEIKVRVKRGGLDVRARKGYWAYTEEDAARASAPPKPEPPSAVTSALNGLAEPVRGRSARFWVGTTRAESGAGLVTFVWEPIAGSPGESRDAASKVLVTATTAGGRQLYRGRVGGTPETATTAVTGGAGGRVSFEAPPGPVQLRLVVEGSGTVVLDSTVRELTVPDFTAVQVSIGTPRVYRARTVREMQTLRSTTSATPLVDREFSRTERILVRVETYAPGTSVPTVTARLLNRAGQSMADLPLKSEGGVSDIELTLSSLASTDYLLEINAKTESGTAQELVAFRVGR